jgi:hypothetical protein
VQLHLKVIQNHAAYASRLICGTDAGFGGLKQHVPCLFGLNNVLLTNIGAEALRAYSSWAGLLSLSSYHITISQFVDVAWLQRK